MRYGNKSIYDRLWSYENGKLAGPYHVQMLLGTACVQKCKFCGRQWREEMERGENIKLTTTILTSLGIETGFHNRIIGIINAINLIDGLDGLASGIVCIASFFMLLPEVREQRVLIATILIGLVGSTLGFLRFNFPLLTSFKSRCKPVSNPGKPDGAFSYSCCFSSTACGAWSVPIASIMPSRIASQMI